jgi:uncharacterized membrane protein YbhN (UPF0104 family)
MTRLLRPSFWLPLLLSVALIVGLLAFGNVATVLAMLRSFRLSYLIVIALLVIAYEAVQYLQWHMLLVALGINVPGRAQVFAYLVGDATKILPIGNYIDNFLLQRSEGTDFGLSSAASLMSVLIEVAVTLVCLAILGIKHWDWLRPVIIVGLSIFLASLWLLSHIHISFRPPAWLTRHASVGKALSELRQFREGTVELVRPGILIHAGLLGALYLLIGGTTLYFVMQGLSITGVSYLDVLAVYYFSTAFSLIFPLPVDIGVSEASGVGALLSYGVDKSAAVSALLILRVVTTGGSIIIALLALLFMRDEVRLVLHERPSESATDKR